MVKRLRTLLRCAVPAAAVLATLAAPALAQQNAAPTATRATDDKSFKPDPPGVYANADLSYVLTSGNSSSSSLGFKGDLTQRWTRHSLGFAAGGIRASSSPPEGRFAVGTPDDYDVQLPESEPTAEAYYARGRYDYRFSERFFYTAGLGWERNRFSGIENRWVLDGGVGYVFLNNDTTSFRGAAGLTYTDEGDTVKKEGQDTSFVGARVGWDLRRKLFSTTTFTHTLIFDQNLEDGSDSRVDAQFGLHVAMNAKLGLKVNWRILFDNQPALAEVPLFAPGGVPTGVTVLAPYKKTDQGLSVSLVFSVAPPKKS
jgi:putative salt-induced outer membrane protein YdiY